MMPEEQPTLIRRSDYSAPAYWIDTVNLSFDLDPAKTRVLNKMTLRRNPAWRRKRSGSTAKSSTWRGCW